MREPTIAAGYPRALVDFAATKGADRLALIKLAGFNEEDLDDPDNRTSLVQYIELYDAAIELTGEPALALQFGEAVRMQEISIVGLICEACETTGEVGPELNRYARLVIDECDGSPPDLLGAQFDESGLWMVGPSDTFALYRHMAEAEVTRLACNIRAMFGKHPFFHDRPFPKAVHFTHDEPSYRSEYDRIFQAPITFNSDRNALLTDPEFLTLKQPPTNRYVLGVLSDRADALLKDLQSATTIRGQVEYLLISLMHTGELDMNTIAKKLGLSRRTLYRSLKAEGVSYAEILDELRRELAFHFLNGKKASINETAYLLGFAHSSAFTRAFKRWTNMSPRSFKSQNIARDKNATISAISVR